MKSKGFSVIHKYSLCNIGILLAAFFFNASNGRFYRSFKIYLISGSAGFACLPDNHSAKPAYCEKAGADF